MNQDTTENLKGFEMYAEYLADESRPRLANRCAPEDEVPGTSELNRLYGNSYRREIELILQSILIFKEYFDQNNEIHHQTWVNMNLAYFRLLGLERQCLMDGPLRGVDTERGPLYNVEDSDSSTS